MSEKTAERAVEGLAFADNIATTTDLAGLKTVITRLEAELKAALKEKASKADIAGLKADLAGLKTAVARLEAELKAELKEKATKADLANLESKMLRWGIGTAVGMTAVIVASVGLMVNL